MVKEEFERNKSRIVKDGLSLIICYNMVHEESINAIKCVFCESLYHIKCVSEWLIKFNACPMCQNVFVVPRLMLVKGHKKMGRGI